MKIISQYETTVTKDGEIAPGQPFDVAKAAAEELIARGTHQAYKPPRVQASKAEAGPEAEQAEPEQQQ